MTELQTPVQTVGEGVQRINDEPTWSTHVGKVASGRFFIWSLVLVAGGLFLYFAATTGNPLSSFGAVAAVTVLWLLFAAWRARGVAELAFMREYARQRKLDYWGSTQLLETTPLLAAGESRKYEHYMEGPLSVQTPDVKFGLAHYSFETYDEIQNKRGVTVEAATPHRMTVCVVEVPEAADVFFGVYLIRRRGLFKSVSGTTWLEFDELRQVELESEAFNRRYDLYVRESQSDYNLLRLFKPSFVLKLAELPSELYFEYHHGTLVVYRFKHSDQAVELDAQIHTTAAIARELREALA